MFQVFSNVSTQAHHPKRTKKDVDVTTMTKQQQKAYASKLFTDGLSEKSTQAIYALAVAGVLSTDQIYRLLNVSDSTLVRLSQKAIIDRMYSMTEEIKSVYGVKPETRGHRTQTKLNRLSPIGIEIAGLLGIEQKIEDYTGYGYHLILHDFLCNEVAVRILERAGASGAKNCQWIGKRQATIRDNNGAPIIEPDAMLVLKNPNGSEQRVIIELHREDTGRRVEDKVTRYEKVYRDGLWNEQWGVNVFPSVLAVFTAPAVGNGYKEAIQKVKRNSMGVKVNYYGKSWRQLLEDKSLAAWFCFNNSAAEAVFPWFKSPESTTTQ